MSATSHTHTHTQWHTDTNACVCIHKHLQTVALCGQHICMRADTHAHTTHTHTAHISPRCFTVTWSYSHRLGSKASWLILFSSPEDLSWIHLCYSCRGGVGILYVCVSWEGGEEICMESAHMWSVCTYVTVSACKGLFMDAYREWEGIYFHVCICDWHQVKDYLPINNNDVMSVCEWWR